MTDEGDELTDRESAEVKCFAEFVYKIMTTTMLTGAATHVVIMGAMEANAQFIADHFNDTAPPDIAKVVAADFGEMIEIARNAALARERDRGNVQ